MRDAMCRLMIPMLSLLVLISGCGPTQEQKQAAAANKADQLIQQLNNGNPVNLNGLIVDVGAQVGSDKAKQREALELIAKALETNIGKAMSERVRIQIKALVAQIRAYNKK